MILQDFCTRSQFLLSCLKVNNFCLKLSFVKATNTILNTEYVGFFTGMMKLVKFIHYS